jgi:hypothetical protein
MTTRLTPQGPFEGELVCGLRWQARWDFGPNHRHYRQVLFTTTVDGEQWDLAYLLDEQQAERGLPLDLLEAEFAPLRDPGYREQLNRLHAERMSSPWCSETTEDRKAPPFADPLAPLPEWLAKVDQVLEEAKS